MKSSFGFLSNSASVYPPMSIGGSSFRCGKKYTYILIRARAHVCNTISPKIANYGSTCHSLPIFLIWNDNTHKRIN